MPFVSNGDASSPIDISSNQAPIEASLFNTVHPIVWIYLLGLMVTFTVFLWGTVQIRTYIRKGNIRYLRKEKAYLVELPENFSGFSFGNYIFLPKGSKQDIILQHEIHHYYLNHSYDIIATKVFQCLLWFNPIVWLWEKEIRLVHEYQVDEKMLESTDRTTYQKVLLNCVFLNFPYPEAANHFNKSITLNRILMMNTSKTKNLRSLRWALPIAFLICLLGACGLDQVDELDAQESYSMEELRKALPAHIYNTAEIHLRNNETGKYDLVSMEFEEVGINNETPIINENIKQLFELSQLVIVDRKDEKIYRIADLDNKDKLPTIAILLSKDGKIYESKSIGERKEGDDIFQVVEEQPEPEIGINAYYEELSKLLEYPAEAKEKGVEGRVFIQFVVNKNGSLSDIEVIKGIGHGLDEVALSAMENINQKWKPGRQKGEDVNVRMVLPITFKL
ncbi:MAG: M56 family metallopeptidase [Cyclobacteriaceae bacterium]|nr:M56 family metallopeptidase [Cyclobacteriaceae bacterium]MCH8516987.1 M56 family metallopeptidase [Cyclobacteriaceae bacterium]